MEVEDARSENNEGGLQGYEKIRVVGKGAFGLAVLYRRLSDSQLVVIKEVNIIELSASERQLALNEVQVLASLHHPNIISYHRSFEREGQLMIEMEFADGGNLNQLLARRTSPLSERAVLHLFRQICAALRHMHEKGVLHRDLKTANVFLTTRFVVKVGDFGISKVLTTRAQAQTILGTPYYISPEMCEGKQYGPKSDVWAAGCILYEMICLEKAFEASNLPALVNKIIRGQFEPIPDSYSAGLGQLVRDILQREPEDRPSAAQLCETRVPELLRGARLARPADLRPTFISLDLAQNAQGDNRSVLYHWRSHGVTFDLEPIPLPPRIKVTEVAAGSGHILVVTTDAMVYSWGEGSRGQLGHDHPESRRQFPQLIESLRGKAINKVGAGRGFSVFGSESGMLMTCGEGEGGCLGHGDFADSARPRIIERLLSVDVTSVSCGPRHVAALGSRGELYTWGLGREGRLGLGHQDNCCSPQEVPLPPELDRSGLKVYAGPDGTALVTAAGTVYAWGSNVKNKLALNRKGICGFMREVEAVWRPSLVPLTFQVSDVTLGPLHTALLTPQGHVFTLGSDHVGGGGGDPRRVAGLGGRVKFLASGADFTVAGTEDNVVLFWGVRHSTKPQLIAGDEIKEINIKEYVNKPQEILALYSSDGAGPTLSLGGLSPCEEPGELLLLLHTSAPLPPAVDANDPALEQGGRLRTVRSADEKSLQQNTIPDWLKAELAAAADHTNYQP